MTIQGVYVGNSPAELKQFENWLGREVDAVHGVVGFANWADYTSSAAWMTTTLWKGINESVLWSVPMLVQDGISNLTAAAAGTYNTSYRSVAQTLLASRAGDGAAIYIRTGWEGNADWFPWSAVGREASFIGAFQQMVDTFRDISPRFKFEWNINFSDGGLDPAKMYPGDAYVDVVGMDFYWTPEYQGSDPVKAFNAIAHAKYGLQWLENFADAHGKPTAYSEWGINSDNAADYLKLVKNWFDTHDVAYQSFWDLTMDKVQALSDGALPTSGAAFRDLFAGSGGASTPVVTTPATPPSLIHGTAGHDNLSGTGGDDTFFADGGDTMTGGKGDDTYIVTSSADVVIEKDVGGTDTVSTWINGHVLADNVENFVLTGTGWNTATGNALNNAIIGNDSPNVIDGRAGNDRLTGGGGGDTFVIVKGMGQDTITDFAPGASVGDIIRLDGFAFSDFAAVKAAAIQNGGDVVIALGDGQTLTLQSIQLAALTAENVSLVNVTKAPVTAPSGTSGTASLGGATTNSIWGSGNTEKLTGTDANDRIASMGGSDTMTGGKGDDTYIVYSGSEKVVEKAGGGIDTVSTWVGQYTLPAHVENLIITGTSWTKATGNALNNVILGNDSPNVIDGKAGNDLLTGGGGSDTFILSKGMGQDTITDFHLHAAGADADLLQLQGFGTGAKLSNTGNLFTVTAANGSSEHFTLLGITHLDASDYVFL